jgi:aryl-alcohol dehydrogenase-like predicted oxidoreductase
MLTRTLGRGPAVSAIGFGAWQIGADWGDVDDETALETLRAAVDAGVTFVDTADVYGDGRSERLIGRLLRERDGLFVATKMGRRAPLDAAEYTLENFDAWTARSCENLGVGTLDLVQLHCPPTDVYYRPEVFAALDELVRRGRIARYGVSVERVEEALKAIEYPGVASVQIIFNPFRQRPAGHFFAAAARRRVGVVVRVPLAGVPYEVGLDAVEELRPLVPPGATLAQMSLRWILMHEAVSTVIPGARSPEQARANAAAADLPPLDDGSMARIAEVYRERIAPHVHQRW